MLQEERLCSSSRTKAERDDVMALAVKSQSRGNSRYDARDKSELFCSYCNRTGHVVSNCYTKNGFPDWWENKIRGSDGRISNKGHGIRDRLDTHIQTFSSYD